MYNMPLSEKKKSTSDFTQILTQYICTGEIIMRSNEMLINWPTNNCRYSDKLLRLISIQHDEVIFEVAILVRPTYRCHCFLESII